MPSLLRRLAATAGLDLLKSRGCKVVAVLRDVAGVIASASAMSAA